MLSGETCIVLLSLLLSPLIVPSHASSNVTNATVQDWYSECFHTFLENCCVAEGDPWIRYSNFDLIEKPSGLCTDYLTCAFDQCSPKGIGDISLLSEVDNFEDVPKDFFGPINLPSHMSFPESAGDIIKVIQHAKAMKKKVSIKATGHSYAGSSTVGGSLQLNLRNLHKYSQDENAIVECINDDNNIIDEACELAQARGKNAYIKVGGGDVWSDVYIALMDYKSGFYDILGGGAGSVGAAGGWLQGGGWSIGMERMYGLGVDQVLEIEMVLSDESHIRFGPREWEDDDGFLYPKTTVVGGYCDTSVANDIPLWEECQDPLPPFQELWFAVRGGSGGSFGVVTAVKYQLHETKPFEVVVTDQTSKSNILSKTESFPIVLEKVTELWMQFLLDLLYHPSNLGITEEESSKCGSPSLHFNWMVKSFLLCYDNVWADVLSTKWIERVNAIEDGSEFDIIREDVRSLIIGYDIFNSYPEVVLSISSSADFVPENLAIAIISNDFVPENALPDNPPPSLIPDKRYGGWCSAVIPAWWLANVDNDEQRSKDIYEILSKEPGEHVTGGFVGKAHDQTTAIPPYQRESGLSSPQLKYIEIEVQSRLLKSFLNKTLDGVKAFPGITEVNHVCIDSFGPMKTDVSKPCPVFEFTLEEKEAQCIGVQESIWGAELLARLEDVKLKVDPSNLFDCNYCIKPTGYHTADITTTPTNSPVANVATTNSPVVDDATESPTSDADESSMVKLIPNFDTGIGMVMIYVLELLYF